MAVTKIWAVHDSVSRVVDYCNNPDKTKLNDLYQVLEYAADKDKTQAENESRYAVTGINCHTETAAQEMLAVQKRFGKTSGNIAYHAYQSFKTGEVSAEECHEIGVELAKRLWGDQYQVLVATHYNTGTYHNHFVINAVGMWDGRKLEAKYKTYYSLRNESDRIGRERGLTVVEDPQKHKTARSVYFAEKNGEPTRYNLMREALDKALSMSSTWSDLMTVLYKIGYELEAGPHRKYVTIRSVHSKKSMRTFRLGPEYEKDAISERLYSNGFSSEVRSRYYDFMEPYTKSYIRSHPPTEEYYRRRDFYFKALKSSGYSTVIKCIALILGLEPMVNEQREKPLSAECREALRKLERYSDEITLVGREHLETTEDLTTFIKTTEEKMDAAFFERNRIRNRLRNCRDPVEKADLKAKCAGYTEVLAELRKQRKTAINIIEDNPKLKTMIEAEVDMRIRNDPYLTPQEKDRLTENLSITKAKNEHER